MKKTLITLALVAATVCASAQKKPATPVPVDTSQYHLSVTDLQKRIDAVGFLSYVVKNGSNDITPNQLRQQVHIADSLAQVDLAWYKKHLPKVVKP